MGKRVGNGVVKLMDGEEQERESRGRGKGGGDARCGILKDFVEK